jgi:hypothetical protein
MPMKVILKPGIEVVLKGDSPKTALVKFPFHRFNRAGVDMDGLEVYFRWRDIVTYSLMSEAEFKTEVDKAKALIAEQKRRNPHPGNEPRVFIPG